ncbi:uncharacterized protein EKO05_0010262 [Ascochyta rabiei]|uniref:Uncharacterized protein n=1 Tax=Didymella rabiei TaxID=5454 RepID=A0A163F2W6_DIDRA|nr:uncharacterized protein EKO05_0010262 [Ascochyta rabiei]KZM24108.1 hypothetical protein ST47_g4749 [Ascochyta rabiei]UPX20016.1 hypothetical protein EKO05_0010262 [Ascochyta rabiei]
MLLTSIGLMLALLNLTAATKEPLQVAHYDDIKNVNPAIGIAPPKPYKFLQYIGYGLGAPVPGTITIQASSAKNAIFAPYLLAGAPLVMPVVFSNYTDSKVLSFDLKSIADGCYAATQNGILAPAINCTIRYTGTKRDGKEVVYDSVYGTGEILGLALHAIPVKSHEFPVLDFSDLVQVKPKIIKATLPNLLGAVAQMAFDDMTYEVTLK